MSAASKNSRLPRDETPMESLDVETNAPWLMKPWICIDRRNRVSGSSGLGAGVGAGVASTVGTTGSLFVGGVSAGEIGA